jgi:asparagine synthase (glutamine-hydrolysing)
LARETTYRVQTTDFSGSFLVSGVYGIVRYDGAPVTRETLSPLVTATSFRGPDGHGQWCGEAVGLGHLMLHVTPESLDERQPAGIRAAPHLVITADARIDNRDELFDALGTPGPGRDRTPDSSLILAAYERWGADCVKRLLGDFAFAIWDSRERKLFCARDPFGCTPFVYFHDGARFIFASDVKGVLAGLDTRRLNEPLLAAYLQMKTYYAEKTMTFFEGIFKLQPGHSLTVTPAGIHTSRYWSPDDAPELRFANAGDYAEQLQFLFGQSVECRLRSAFPIGSHLSGGLDSSAVSVMASRILRERGRELATFSWSPPPDPAAGLHPEGEYARIDAVCRQEDLSCNYAPVTKASLISNFQRDFTVEPVSMMPRESNVQARAQARQVRVMLSGWGGDDAVTCRAVTSPAHYLANHQWAEFGRACQSWLHPSGLKAQGPGGLLRELTMLNLPDALYARTRRNAFQAHKSPCVQLAFARLYQEQVKHMRGPALRRLAGVRPTICRFLDSGHLSLRAEHWAGSGARHGMVYRYPLLDRRLVEFALGVPPSQSRETDQRRSLFRQAVIGMLPPSVEWDAVKREPATFAALEKEHIQAHSEFADHLAPQLALSPATKFVDSGKITAAIQSATRSGHVGDLSGVKEAFGFYAIPW